MAQTAGYRPVSVISHRYCIPRSVNLAVTQRVWQFIGRGDFVVNDPDGNVMFKVEGSFFSFNGEKLILDAHGLPIVTLRSKKLSAHSRWQVFRGESSKEKDLIFSAKRSSMFQMKTKLHVFLANNMSEDVCDYRVQGSWLGGSSQVYIGDSSTIIAQIKRSSSIRSQLTGKNKYMVTVWPDVDTALVVALLVILDEITSEGNRSSPNT